MGYSNSVLSIGLYAVAAAVAFEPLHDRILEALLYNVEAAVASGDDG